MKSTIFVTAAIIGVFAGHQARAAYDFFSVNDGSNTTALGINNAGVIVGNVGSSGFKDVGGSFTAVNVPGAVVTFATDISSAGVVVGYSTTSGGTTTGFNAATTAYTFSGATGGTYLTSISEDGTNTGGYFVDASSMLHGFITSPATQIDVPSGTMTTLGGVNNAGTAVGSYFDSGAGIQRGFLLTVGGTPVSISDPLGVNGTYLTSINDDGVAAGYYLDGNNETHGFLYYVATGTYQTIDAFGLASADTAITGINDSGEIVGTYDSPAIGPTSFAATVPEPATLAVLGFGTAALMATRRRRYF